MIARPRIVPLLVVLAALGRPELAPADEAASDPAERLHRCLGALSTCQRQCSMGAMVAEEQTGRVLYALNARVPVNPASNIKLITSAAALHQLGQDYRFGTEIYGRLRRGVVRGGLTVRGSGDPSLTTAVLNEIALELYRRGVRRIEGPLYLDTSSFAESGDPPGYGRFPSSHPFRAGVDALNLNHNVLRITVAPAARPGERASVTVEPASGYLRVVATAMTSARGGKLSLSTHAQGPYTGVRVSGRIRWRSGPRTFWRRVFHPALYFGHTLVTSMRAAGIELSGEVARRRVAEGTPRLLDHQSIPLALIVRSATKQSSNVVAELLLLTLGIDLVGEPATYEKGRHALQSYLQRFGIAPGSYWLENGSGLSRRSRIRPADLVRVLAGIHRDFAASPDVLASLPLAGVDGTLRRRFRGTAAIGSIRAKTGTLSGVSCLSGYAGGPEGERLLFSFLAGRARRAPVARRALVAMATCLVGYLDDLHKASTIKSSRVSASSAQP